MPEHRARKHHQDRVAETLREEIGAMIEGELVDPRIAFCYVTEVVLNPGGKSARVYVAVDSAVPDITKAEEDTVAGLEAAKGFIRLWGLGQQTQAQKQLLKDGRGFELSGLLPHKEQNG